MAPSCCVLGHDDGPLLADLLREEIGTSGGADLPHAGVSEHQLGQQGPGQRASRKTEGDRVCGGRDFFREAPLGQRPGEVLVVERLGLQHLGEPLALRAGEPVDVPLRGRGLLRGGGVTPERRRCQVKGGGGTPGVREVLQSSLRGREHQEARGVLAEPGGEQEAHRDVLQGLQLRRRRRGRPA